MIEIQSFNDETRGPPIRAARSFSAETHLPRDTVKTKPTRLVADLQLVDGDPTAHIKLVEDPAKNFMIIMKDGKVFKNLFQ